MLLHTSEEVEIFNYISVCDQSNGNLRESEDGMQIQDLTLIYGRDRVIEIKDFFIWKSYSHI